MEDVGTPSKPPRKVGSKVLRACVTTEDPSAAETYAEILKTPGEVGDLWMEIWKRSCYQWKWTTKKTKHQGIQKIDGFWKMKYKKKNWDVIFLQCELLLVYCRVRKNVWTLGLCCFCLEHVLEHYGPGGMLLDGNFKELQRSRWHGDFLPKFLWVRQTSSPAFLRTIWVSNDRFPHPKMDVNACGPSVELRECRLNETVMKWTIIFGWDQTLGQNAINLPTCTFSSKKATFGRVLGVSMW